MWRMLQADQPEDFVIVMGETHTVQAFLEEVFALADLDWWAHVVSDSALFVRDGSRPADGRFERSEGAAGVGAEGEAQGTRAPDDGGRSRAGPAGGARGGDRDLGIYAD